ncbi:hypothetical protein C8J55DRAFT_500299 [Lentinula edodes]|uniref:Uncharacterized protein n=1 Tax=Lentinula lateritia TaxID=40482 RepID=A0A9W9B079_9AGAR|nr:hypothetical protein C8J55DRAFT_500299 [Lentinula edodes]
MTGTWSSMKYRKCNPPIFKFETLLSLFLPFPLSLAKLYPTLFSPQPHATSPGPNPLSNHQPSEKAPMHDQCNGPPDITADLSICNAEDSERLARCRTSQPKIEQWLGSDIHSTIFAK